MTPLMFSSHAGSLECVRMLIWAEADVNAREEDRWTPLHFAAKEAHFEVCVALLQGRADPSARNCDDLTPLQIALDDSEDACGDFAQRFRKLIQCRGTSSVGA
mmetsp:Transcript_53523/g.150362  ORF Transcript_53523/g.150362 Transcript_53523/m.150362 type:complete len:103 (+) Transcript_53523:1-309(+)